MMDEEISDDDRYFENNDEENNSNSRILMTAIATAPTRYGYIPRWCEMNNSISTLNSCETTSAKSILILDIDYKLENNDRYDIGGAYRGRIPEFWFFFTTTTLPGRKFIVNIFVCHRKPGMFAIGISNLSDIITCFNDNKVRTFSGELVWKKFNTSQPDEVHNVHTYSFSASSYVNFANNILIIPISIDLSPKSMLNPEMVQSIQAAQDFGENLFKGREPDFVLQSNKGKEYKVHKIVLAAHSPVIRDSIRANNCNTLTLDLTDAELELLLQYLYNGNIKDILNKNLEMLLALSQKYQLNNLLELVKHALKNSIDSDNVLSIAVLAEIHNYDDIQKPAFKYIATHPEVLESDAFAELNNANLVKKLLKYIHVKAPILD